MEAVFIENEKCAAVCEFHVLFATSVDSVLTRASRAFMSALTKLLTIYINKIQQDATVCRYLFTAKSLYMFRVSIAPINRST